MYGMVWYAPYLYTIRIENMWKMREKVWKNVNLPVQSLIQLYLHTVQRHEKHENNLGKGTKHKVQL